MSQRERCRSYLARSILTFIALGVTAATVFLHSTVEVDANGITVPIARGVSGPYEYLAGIFPPNPGVGDLHMSITLVGDQSAVIEAVVTVQGRVAGSTEHVGPIVASDDSQPGVYELNLYLGQPGNWVFEIEINSVLGRTMLDLDLEVVADAPPLVQETEELGTTGQMPSVQTPTVPAESVQGTTDKAEDNQEATDRTKGQGFSWVIIVMPLVVLAILLWARSRWSR